MAFEDVYLALGSNLGDREANLRCALDMLDEAFGSEVQAVSDIMYNPARGFSGGEFANCVVCYHLDMEPMEVLRVCKDIERRMGRDTSVRFTPDGRRLYSDRIIDIDIILFGDRRIDTPLLTIPHPRMEERDFVMIPLRQIFKK